MPGTAAAPEQEPPVTARIGARIRSVRLARGHTQAWVAKSSGITQSALSNYESGKREPSLPLLIAIAQALEVGLGDLLGTHLVLSTRDSRLREVTRLLVEQPVLLDALVRETSRQPAPLTPASAPR